MCTWQVGAERGTGGERGHLWGVVGTFACCFRAKLVLGPPHYHDAFQMCQTSRVGISMGSRCARGKWGPRGGRAGKEGTCGGWLEHSRVVFGPSWCLVHHTTMTPFKCARRREWVSRWGRDVHVASGCQGEKSRVEMPLVACDWVYRVLFSGQVGAWSTTLP